MTPHFGSKVSGHEAYDAAVRNEAGGGNVFGSRVIGAITGSGPTNDAKRNSQFGVNVVDQATGSNAKGEVGADVSIDELRNILAENPTFLDSLYEAELAREGKPRPDALAIFYEVERGIKGQMRPDVMAEIRGLIGEKGVSAGQEADAAKVDHEMLKRRVARQEANSADLGLGERDAAAKAVAANTDHQRDGISEEIGVDLKPGRDAEKSNATGSVPTKPDGPVHAETQSSGPRLGVPKGTSGTSSAGTSAGGSRPASGAASTSTEGDSTVESSAKGTEGENAVQPDDFTKPELESALTKALGEEKFGKIKGTGSDGAVLKADLVKAAKKGLSDGTLTIQSGYIVASS